MSSYDIIRHASRILSRVSCSGLPETAVGEMGYRFRTGDMEGASSLVTSLMSKLQASMTEDDIRQAFILLDIINCEMLEELAAGA